MAARNAARHVVAAVSKNGLMPSGYQVRAAGLYRPPLSSVFALRAREAAVSMEARSCRRGPEC
jgi:hypothetical protein